MKHNLKKLCNDFNKKYPVGTAVMLKKDFVEDPIKTRVKVEAYVLSGHSAVSFFEGIRGCYDISCVIGEIE